MSNMIPEEKKIVEIMEELTCWYRSLLLEALRYHNGDIFLLPSIWLNTLYSLGGQLREAQNSFRATGELFSDAAQKLIGDSHDAYMELHRYWKRQQPSMVTTGESSEYVVASTRV